MKTILMLSAMVAGTALLAAPDSAKADHCRYGGYGSSYYSPGYYYPRTYSYGRYSPRYYGSRGFVGYPAYGYSRYGNYGYRPYRSGLYINTGRFSFGFYR